MLSALKTLFTPTSQQPAHAAYISIVAASRRPVFYQDWQVADTMDGRFDIIVLHLFLLVSRLEKEPGAQDFIRSVSEIFFADMDRSLREMGVGDTGVGIRVKNMAQAFYGRLASYSEAADTAALMQALRRNVWREQPVADASVTALAQYIERNRESLRAQSAEALTSSEIIFLS